MKLKEYYENIEISFKENFEELYDEYVDEISTNRTDADIINRIIEEWAEENEIVTEEYPCENCSEKSKKCEDDWCNRFDEYLKEDDENRRKYTYNLKKNYDILTVRDIRDRFNLTQKALSEITGIPTRTIENWDGEKSVAAKYLIKLIDFYVEHHAE